MTTLERAKELVNKITEAVASDPHADIDAIVVLALKEQDKITRHACAELVTKLSASVAEANTESSKFACGILDRASAIIMNAKTE